MTTPRRTALNLFAAVATAACAATNRTRGRQTMPTAQAKLTRAYRDMAAGNTDRLMDLYMPDALIQNPGERPIAGTKAIRAFWQTTFEQYHVRLVPDVQEVTSFGEIVVVRGRAVGVLAPKSGDAPIPVDSWFMQIYRRQAEGTLRFWRGTNGPNAAAGGDSP